MAEQFSRLVIDTLNRVETKVDRVQTTQAEHGERIAVLETTLPAAAAEAARNAVDAHISAKRKTWAGWGATVGALAGGAFELAHRVFGK